MFVAALIVLAVPYFWDKDYNTGKILDGWMTCDETSPSTCFIEALICVPRPTTARSEVRTAMAGNNSESSMEANTSQDGQGAAAEVFDNYRSLRDSNSHDLCCKNVVPPFRFKAGGWELI
jgi:hypothetical protein